MNVPSVKVTFKTFLQASPPWKVTAGNSLGKTFHKKVKSVLVYTQGSLFRKLSGGLFCTHLIKSKKGCHHDLLTNYPLMWNIFLWDRLSRVFQIWFFHIWNKTVHMTVLSIFNTLVELYNFVYLFTYLWSVKSSSQTRFDIYRSMDKKYSYRYL